MKRMKVRIRENSLVARIAARRLGTANVAIVFGHTIHLYNVSAAQFVQDRRWLLHELKHVEQYERLGFLGFLGKYLLESLRRGYYDNALEIEARAAEQDISLYERYDLSGYGISRTGE